MKTIFYVLCVLSLIITKRQTLRAYRPKPDFSHPKAIWNKCGLRYQPFMFVIQYPNKCFTKPLADKPMWDELGEGVIELSTIESRIGGGRNVIYRESPWTVSITKIVKVVATEPILADYGTYKEEVKIMCTGSLLNVYWIITAGHCVDSIADRKHSLTFMAGRDVLVSHSDIKYWKTEYENPIFHPLYHTRRPEYDVALVKLIKPFDTGLNDGLDHFVINNVCLPSNDSAMPYNIQSIGTVFGFGRIGMDCDNKPYKYSNTLQTTDMVFTYCEGRARFCAPINYSRTCHGDSGASFVKYTDKTRARAVLMGTLRGTLYEGEEEIIKDEGKDKAIASSFTVVHQYLDWIWKHIDKK